MFTLANNHLKHVKPHIEEVILKGLLYLSIYLSKQKGKESRIKQLKRCNLTEKLGWDFQIAPSTTTVHATVLNVRHAHSRKRGKRSWVVLGVLQSVRPWALCFNQITRASVSSTSEKYYLSQRSISGRNSVQPQHLIMRVIPYLRAHLRKNMKVQSSRHILKSSMESSSLFISHFMLIYV